VHPSLAFFEYRLIVLGLAFLSGVNYHASNMYNGFIAAKDKGHAMLCMVPFFQTYCMIWCA